MTNATVYLDTQSNFANSGWVCETDEDGRPQYQLDATSENTSDELLIAEAEAFADGEITVLR